MTSKTDHQPFSIYNYDQPFSANYTLDVEIEPAPPELLEAKQGRSLLGQPVGYPIGVPASPLTANAERIAGLASQGLNVLTYKTVRSEAREAFPAPNWFFVAGMRRPLPVEAALEETTVQISGTKPPSDSGSYSMVNSFGMPSQDPAKWMPDIEAAVKALRDEQILIVSVVGTYESYKGDALLEDFVQVARLAESAGAKAIELNLSCPNTLAEDGDGMGKPLCENPGHTQAIVQAVRKGLKSETRLVAKLGYLAPIRLAEVVERIAGQVDAIAGINTWQVNVTDASGKPAFRGTPDDPDRDRPKAGLSGVAIRDLALDFVRELALLRRERDWSFDIIGMGGVMNTHDVRALMASGADAVQATSVIANDVHFARGLWNEEQELGAALKDDRWIFRTAEGVADDLHLSVESARNLLDSSPSVARKTAMTDRLGRELYTARDRSPTIKERLERLRWILAH
jgi:dihydroorotate dehydrogenase